MLRAAPAMLRSRCLPAPGRLVPQCRTAVGIRIMEEKGKAAEKLYWAQEDEKLLKKMLESNPELDPSFQGISNILSSSEGSTADQVKLIFMKHGIPPLQKGLIADLVALVEKESQ